MNIGSFVWNVFNGVLRFGTIVRMDLDVSGWAHCSVVWHDDEVYNRALAGEATTERLYRVDELGLVPTDHLAESVKQHIAVFPTKFNDSGIPAC